MSEDESKLSAAVDSAKFIVEFLRSPNVTGAVAPSSHFLAEKIVEWIEWESTSTIIEWGPGTGSFTKLILEHKPESCRYMAMELNPEMCAILRKKFPGIEICEESVTEVVRICESECIEEVDCVVSGLPWAVFSEEVQTAFMKALMCVLKPGGQFTTFAYLHGLQLPAGKRFKAKLREFFSEVSLSEVVWANVPPARVYRCRR